MATDGPGADRVKQAMRLAESNQGACRVCARVGPLNGALAVWWGGMPVLVVCPECMLPGRQALVRRSVDGLEVGLMEESGRPSIVVAGGLPAMADLSQVAVQRAKVGG